MNTWQLPHLMSRVLGGERARWRWVAQGDESGPIWSLVQADAFDVEHEVGIYVFAESLPLAAKVFAGVTPAVLHETSQRALKVMECLERLERMSYSLRRLRTRAYRSKRTDEYGDLRGVMAELAVAKALLEAAQMPSLADLEQLEYEAIAALQNPPTGP